MDIFFFLTCTCCGILSGIVYDILYIARCVVCGVNKQNYSVKDRIFTVACDLVYCLFFAAAYVFVSVIFDFSGLRVFMLLGCALGAVLYLKSFHLFVAFFVNKLYNRINNKIKMKKTENVND